MGNREKKTRYIARNKVGEDIKYNSGKLIQIENTNQSVSLISKSPHFYILNSCNNIAENSLNDMQV